MEEPKAPMENTPKPFPVGKLVWYLLLAALVVVAVWQYFEIQEKCYLYEAYDNWQSNFC